MRGEKERGGKEKRKGRRRKRLGYGRKMTEIRGENGAFCRCKVEQGGKQFE